MLPRSRQADLGLESLAGTGLMAALAEIFGGHLALNELAEIRAGMLAGLFPAAAVTRFHATLIHDPLDSSCCPSVVLMNPPFSGGAGQEQGFGCCLLSRCFGACASGTGRAVLLMAIFVRYMN